MEVENNPNGEDGQGIWERRRSARPLTLNEMMEGLEMQLVFVLRFDVVRDVAFNRCAVRTERALERLFAGVRPDVPDEIGSAVENFAAEVAHIVGFGATREQSVVCRLLEHFRRRLAEGGRAKH